MLAPAQPVAPQVEIEIGIGIAASLSERVPRARLTMLRQGLRCKVMMLVPRRSDPGLLSRPDALPLALSKWRGRPTAILTRKPSILRFSPQRLPAQIGQLTRGNSGQSKR